MDLRQYVRAIRRSWWIILVIAVLGCAAGYAKATREPKVYAAGVSFYIGTPKSDGSTAYGNDQFAQQRANSYAELLSSQRFARLVLANSTLRLTAGELAAKISGSAQIDTVFVNATMRDTSVRRLRSIQSAVAARFPDFISQQIETTETVKLQVTSDPPVSAVPVAPRTSIDAFLGLAAGIILGLLIAGLREIVDTSLRSGTELEDLVGVPLIGSIVYDSSAGRQPVVDGSGNPSRRAEDFRQLRTNLEFIHTAARVQVVVVTSSVAGEGKSSTAVNIAATAAERGARVLLVDADLRRPQVADYLGFDRFVGLTTVLAGQVAESIAVRSWGEHGLAVLPSGATPPNPSELLNSEPMRELVTQWRALYDLIVIDTPPALIVTDAAVCSELADGVLLVYRYGKTRRANLTGALHALRTVDARIVGVVLNMRPRKGADGERYGSYDAYVAGSKQSRLRRLLARAARIVPRRLRRRKKLPPTFGPASPALNLTAPARPAPIAEPEPAAGFRPPTELTPTDVLGPPDDDAGFQARRRRRPLRSGRVRTEHLYALDGTVGGPTDEPAAVLIDHASIEDESLEDESLEDQLFGRDAPVDRDDAPAPMSAINGHGTNGHDANGRAGAHRSDAVADPANA